MNPTLARLKLALVRAEEPLIWGILLFLFNVVYLLVELSFNARLTDVAGSLAQPDEVKALAIYGRIISGIGACGLCVRWIGYRRVRGVPAIWTPIAIVLLVWPTVYFGQRMWIDAEINSSTLATRRAAAQIAFVRQALVSNAIVVRGFPSGLAAETANGKVFNGMVGLLVWGFPYLGHEFSNLNSIAYAFASKSVDRERLWREFQQAVLNVRNAYADYRHAGRVLADVVKKIPAQAAEAWTAMEQVNNEWEKYQSAREEARRMRPDTNWLHGRLRKYFAWCNPYGFYLFCTRGARREYSDESYRLVGRYINPKKWCMGKSCPGPVEYVANVVDRVIADEFKNRTGVDISLSYTDFLNKLTSSELFVKNGLELPVGIDTASKPAFMAAFQEYLKDQAERRHASAMQIALGEVPPRDLSLSKFSTLAGVQRALLEFADREGIAREDIARINLNWTKKEFDQQFVEVRLQKAASALTAPLTSPLSEYSDGSSLESSSKDAERGLIVPVLAMTLSLFFGLTNAVLTAAVLVRCLLAVFLLDANISVARVISHVIGALGLVGILVVPYFHSLGLAAAEGYAPVIRNLEKESIALAFTVSWVARMQPEFYPLGQRVRVSVLGGSKFDDPPWR